MQQLQIGKEHRIQQALNHIKRQDQPNLRRIAREFDVDYLTLWRRKGGTETRSEQRPPNSRLNAAEDAALCYVIDRWDAWNLPRNPQFIKMTAIRLLRERQDGDCEPKPLPKNWLATWFKHHPQYSIVKIKALDVERKLACTYPVLSRYFTKLDAVINGQKVKTFNIYNMDETGFLVGVAGQQTVGINHTGRYNKPETRGTNPGDRELMTSMECISADGTVIPPLIVVKSVHITHSDIIHHRLPDDYAIEATESGQSNDEVYFKWLQHFEYHTRFRSQGSFRLLTTDGHQSHFTFEALEFCSQHKIIPFMLPAHTTHLLQPLDVGCFGPMKHYHQAAIEEELAYGAASFHRRDLLAWLHKTRVRTFKKTTVRSAFRKTGIWPFNSSIILDHYRHEHDAQSDSENDQHYDYHPSHDGCRNTVHELGSSDLEYSPQKEDDIVAREEWLLSNFDTPSKSDRVHRLLIDTFRRAKAMRLACQTLEKDLEKTLEITEERRQRRQLDRRQLHKESGVWTMGEARRHIKSRAEQEKEKADKQAAAARSRVLAEQARIQKARLTLQKKAENACRREQLSIERAEVAEAKKREAADRRAALAANRASGRQNRVSKSIKVPASLLHTFDASQSVNIAR